MAWLYARWSHSSIVINTMNERDVCLHNVLTNSQLSMNSKSWYSEQFIIHAWYLYRGCQIMVSVLQPYHYYVLSSFVGCVVC